MMFLILHMTSDYINISLGINKSFSIFFQIFNQIRR